jgi:hypothetical protein
MTIQVQRFMFRCSWFKGDELKKPFLTPTPACPVIALATAETGNPEAQINKEVKNEKCS